MWWETVYVNARPREAPDGGVWGPGVRWGHTCNAVQGGRYLYVFGGYGSDKCQTNDVHVFDTVNRTWSKPMMNGVPPSPRDSHSCTTVGNRLFVFGGTDGKKPLKDLHVLDTATNTWIQPTMHGKGPDAREGHGAALIGKRLFIFGGCGKSSDNQNEVSLNSSNTQKEVYYNDLYVLDTEKLIWEGTVTYGTPPLARDSHSCSSWKNKIIVIGGEDSSDCYLYDVHVLDADTLVWEKMETTGQMLPPRAGHTTVALGSNLFVFGGFTDARNLYDDLHVLNVESGIWSKLMPVNRGPSARFSVASDCLDERKGILVLMGGCNRSLEALDDMYYLHTDMPVVNGIQRQEKFSIKRELKKKCREEYLLVERFDKNNDVPKFGVASDQFQPVYLQQCNLAGRNLRGSRPADEFMFEAIITNANQYGYAIETVINGKVLHGMLFSCTSSFSQDNYGYPNKRIATDIGSGRKNVYERNLKTITPVHQESQNLDEGRADGVQGKTDAKGKESVSQETDGAQGKESMPRETGSAQGKESVSRDSDGSHSKELMSLDNDSAQDRESTLQETGAQGRDSMPQETGSAQGKESVSRDSDGGQRKELSLDNDSTQGKESTLQDTDGAQSKESTQQETDGVQGKESTEQEIDGAQGKESTVQETDSVRCEESRAQETDCAQGKESTSHKSPMETLPSNLINSTSNADFHPPSMVSLNN